MSNNVKPFLNKIPNKIPHKSLKYFQNQLITQFYREIFTLCNSTSFSLIVMKLDPNSSTKTITLLPDLIKFGI